jgi:hypothetical protein
MNNGAIINELMLPYARSLALACVLLGAADTHAQQPATDADHVFLGEHIITLESREANPTALAVRGERIVWVGDRKNHQTWVSETTEVHELGEQALLPGFIDAHGHLTYLASSAKSLISNLCSRTCGNTSRKTRCRPAPG